MAVKLFSGGLAETVDHTCVCVYVRGCGCGSDEAIKSEEF